MKILIGHIKSARKTAKTERFELPAAEVITTR